MKYKKGYLDVTLKGDSQVRDNFSQLEAPSK